MEFRVLGPLEVLDEGREVPLERQRLRAVLAFLLLHANERVPADRLIDEIWGPEPPKSASASLQNHVSQLRKLVGRDVLPPEAGGYVLRVDPERFDLARFRRLVADARRATEPSARAGQLAAALALWRGPPLEDLTFETFAQPEIRRLEEERLEVLELRIEADIDCGRGAGLVGELEALVAQQPLRERLRALLMRALYAAGRQADALDAYRDARRMLSDELGLEPSDELRALERAILHHDPALGAAPAGAPERPDSRRTVSLLFCDLVASTQLAHQLDPEAYRELMTRYLEAVRSAIERHGGAVEKFIGDAVMAVFGAPALHEDDALRGVRAAVDARAAVAALGEALAVRIAVNTGEVVVVPAGRDLTVTGPAVSVAAHLEEAAPDGAIVLGEETYKIVRHAVRAEPLELGDGVRGWRLDEVTRDAPAVSGRDDAPMIGREQQLSALRGAFAAACRKESCGVVTIVGEAGIGKTRLARALVRSLEHEARVLVGRCVSYGQGATYLPLAEVVRQVAPEPTAAGLAALLAGERDGARVAEQVAGLTGLADGAAAPGEAFWAVRRFVEALAREGPLLLALDDVHWAEPTLLDLVEYLGEWAQGPILLLCLARRELLEARPGWGGPTSTGFLVELEPLPAQEAGVLLGFLTDEPLAADVRERIVDRAGGNPLFAQQLVALAEEAPELPIEKAPPSIEALIGSRLDRLDAQALAVIRRASVLGRRFSPAELADVCEAPPGPQLAELERRRLLHPSAEGDGYRFHHVLVRDVSYRGIPKTERAELHERVAGSLDRRGGADELVGYHFEQAHRYLLELARDGDHAERLAAAGGERLGHAAIRACKRADAAAASNLLRRAIDLLPSTEPTRPELACELGLVLWRQGELAQAEAVLEDVLAGAVASADRRIELRARVELASIRATENAAVISDSSEFAASVIPELEALGDDRAVARAWVLLGQMRGDFEGNYAALEEAAARAREHYLRSGWPPSTAVGTWAAALNYGPRPVGEGIARCEELLQSHANDQASEASVLLYLSRLQAMCGDFEQARATIESARSIYEQLGQTFAATAWGGASSAAIEVLANNPTAAETALREACEACRRANATAFLASYSGKLADVLYLVGRLEEAEEWSSRSRELAMPDDRDAQAWWRTVTSKLVARRGDVHAAAELAAEALAVVEQTDALNLHAKVSLDYAEVLRAGGRRAEAAHAVADAVRLYELKGNRVAAARARALAEVSTVAST